MRILTLAALCVVACSAAAHAQPPQPTRQFRPRPVQVGMEDRRRIGIWAERCDLETGVWEPRFEASLPGFVLTVDGEDQGTILQVFDKPADAEVSAILPALREKGYIPDDDECVFEPAAIRPAPRTIAFFTIMPTGVAEGSLRRDAGGRGARAALRRVRLVDPRRPLFPDRHALSRAGRLRQHRPGRHDVRRHDDHAGVGRRLGSVQPRCGARIGLEAGARGPSRDGRIDHRAVPGEAEGLEGFDRSRQSW